MLGSGQESYMKDICQGYREMLSQAVMTNQTCNLPASPRVTLPQTFSPAVKSSLHCTQLAELVLDWTHTRKGSLIEVKVKRYSRVGLWRKNSQDTGRKVNQQNNTREPSVRCANCIGFSIRADFKTVNKDLFIHACKYLRTDSFIISHFYYPI